MKFGEIDNLSDLDLVKYYIKGNSRQKKQAMDAFVLRHNVLIDKCINKTLDKYYIDPSSEIIIIINLEIIERIYYGLLEKAENIDNIKAWFRKVVENHTIDWIKKKYQLSNAYQAEIEDDTISLDTPISPESGLTLGSMISDDSFELWEIETELQYALGLIETIENQTLRLGLKVVIMLYNPLSDAVIQDIAQMREVPPEKITEEINQISKFLLIKYEEVLNNHQQALNHLAMLKRLNGQLFYLKNASVIDHKKIAKVKEEISKKTQARHNLLKKHQNFIRPSAKQIQTLMGTTYENASYIDVCICRARKILKKELNKVNNIVKLSQSEGVSKVKNLKKIKRRK